MTKAEMSDVMDRVFDECRGTREEGQKEYSHREENAFANFERVAERLGMSREQTLLVYLEKHLDGIHSYVQGHQSQREPVTGRIKDAIVYLCLLWGMVEENDLQRLGVPDEEDLGLILDDYGNPVPAWTPGSPF